MLFRYPPPLTGTLSSTLRYLNIQGGSSAGNGGGIEFSPPDNDESTVTLNILYSTISHNLAGNNGGGLYVDSGGLSNSHVINIENSTIDSNQAQNGGGIFAKSVNNGANPSLTINLKNSTISSNIASPGVGGGLNIWQGGDEETVRVYINNSTISHNAADDDTNGGGGIYITNDNDAEPGIVSVKNSIIAVNEANGGASDCNSGAEYTSYGYNLIKTNCGITTTTGDITGSDPSLGNLLDLGGNTFTRGIDDSSPAYNTGSCTNIGGTTVTLDQRGMSRDDGSCDIGAYEFKIWYLDSDGDGYGDSATMDLFNNTSYVDNDDDCDDTDATIHPGATETCGDAIDSDCDGGGDLLTLFTDDDEDGYGDSLDTGTQFDCDDTAAIEASAAVGTNDDCNDADAEIAPSMDEICEDLIDNNCDGIIDDATCSEAEEAVTTTASGGGGCSLAFNSNADAKPMFIALCIGLFFAFIRIRYSRKGFEILK